MIIFWSFALFGLEKRDTDFVWKQKGVRVHCVYPHGALECL